MTKLRDYHEISDKIETFCGRPQVAPTNKFGNQQNDKQEFCTKTKAVRLSQNGDHFETASLELNG